MRADMRADVRDGRRDRRALGIRFSAFVAGFVLIAGGSAVSCFSPREPPCAFSCLQPPHACPADYTCGSDGYCRRVGATATCDYGGDAGRDGSAGADSVTEGDAGAE